MDSLTRVFGLYRTTSRSRTAIALIVANAIPIVGVLFFGWSLLTILVLYWVENAIVGLWNVPKIVLAQGSMLAMPIGGPSGTPIGAPLGTLPNAPPRAALANLIGGRMPTIGRVAMAAFFAVHYGGFWVGHGVFVFALPSFARAFEPGSAFCDASNVLPTYALCGAGPFGEVVWSNVAIAAVALFLSHGASFFLNYFGRGEYRRTSPPQQMFAPYGRVVVLHLTILFGAFVAALLGAPLGVLLILVVLKTSLDLRLHVREGTGTLVTEDA